MTPNKDFSKNPSEEIEEYFNRINKLAQELNPTLLEELNSFNESRTSVESYANFFAAIDQSPLATNTNAVQ